MRFDYAERFVCIGDLEVRYWDEGQGEPLLLVHGMGACLEVWAWNVDALSRHHRVIALDLPGCGKSCRPARQEVFCLDHASEFLCRFAERLGLPAFSVAGNSMGGVLALELALKAPELVRRLILVDSGGLGTEVHWLVRMMSLPFPDGIVAHPPRWVGRRIARAMLHRHDPTTERLFDRAIDYYYMSGTAHAALAMARTGVGLKGQTKSYAPSELGKIRAPTLVVWGQEDRVIPVHHAEVALQAIQNCRAVVMRNAGHGPQIDRPEVFNQSVLEFLATGRLAEERAGGKRLIRL